MALLPETRAALARYDAWLAGVVQSPERLAARARRMVRHVARRVRNMVFGMLGVVFLAFLYGNLVAPIGFLGLLLMLFAMLGVAVLLAGWPPLREPGPPKLGSVSLSALPQRLCAFLEQVQAEVPPGVAADLDRLLVRLGELAPELRRLPPESPEADDARRLLAGHLPRLVESYRRLPPSARAGATAEAHVRDGLRMVAAEVERLTEALAAGRLRALETEGRFLGSRYGGPEQRDD